VNDGCAVARQLIDARLGKDPLLLTRCFTFVAHANLKDLAVVKSSLAEEVYYYELQAMGFSNCPVKGLEYFYVDLGHYNRIYHRYELDRTSCA